MPPTDPRIDAYIERAAAFARPLLADWRALVHQGCPEVEETIKWGMPHFVLRGKILANMAAFKAHCSFGFWHGEAVAQQGKSGAAMGQLGRVTGAQDLPPRAELAAMVARARALIEAGVKPARAARPAAKKPAPELPAELAAALAGDAGARAFFSALAPSHQREYVDWIGEAKRPETRAKRLAQTLQWLAEGKRRNWKYENC